MNLESQIKDLLEGEDTLSEEEFVEEVEEVEETKKVEDTKTNSEDEGMKEHIDALLNGEELSEDFRAKAATIFEAAVEDGIKNKLAQLEEQYDEKLNEALVEVEEDLVNKIDEYLSTVVEEWIQENQLAIETGVKADLAESFIDGLKQLFNEHYVDIPEAKKDIFEENVQLTNELKIKLDESESIINELAEELHSLKKVRSIEVIGEDLTDSQFDKFVALCEHIDFVSEDSFLNKIKTIKENYFSTKTVKSNVNLDTPVPVEDISESINNYVKALSNPLTFKK